MRSVLVTGAKGFIGKNLVSHLKARSDLSVIEFDTESSESDLDEAIEKADYIYHLAGVNRPVATADFDKGNFEFTEMLLAKIKAANRNPILIMSSSTQAVLDNPYGVSKKKAEVSLMLYKKERQANVFIYRLTNVFGKWARPNYNSVVATFCYRATRGEPLVVDDVNKVLDFVYIDDVIKSFANIIDNVEPENIGGFAIVSPTYSVLLKDLANKIISFQKIRVNSTIPDFANLFDKYLYSTYLSYLDSSELSYPVAKKEDARGYLFELIKSVHAGQIFVSRTNPGITRGNHFHHSKVEKFCVIEGAAKITFRNENTNEVVEYLVEGKDCKVVDIPPGWAHNILNMGKTDLLTIFWSNEIFDQNKPDTYFAEV